MPGSSGLNPFCLSWGEVWYGGSATYCKAHRVLGFWLPCWPEGAGSEGSGAEQGSLDSALCSALNISSLDRRVLAASREPQAFLVSRVTE